MSIFIQCLPLLLQMIGLGLKKAGAHADTIKAFQALVDHTKNDGAIATVEAKHIFQDQKTQLDAMFAKPKAVEVKQS